MFSARPRPGSDQPHLVSMPIEAQIRFISTSPRLGRTILVGMSSLGAIVATAAARCPPRGVPRWQAHLELVKRGHDRAH
eukprot:scaffold97_cov375-Prasinococcus_capsulatus_cf.AAC.4